MRLFLLPLFLLIAMLPRVFADATKTVGTTGADYSTLKSAFDDINAGNLTGVITLQIIANTTESASATLYQSGYSGHPYTSVTIYPTVPGVTISGNLALPLIDLNGANNVTIDGRVNEAGSTQSLTVSNTNATATAGTSTIRFINDAVGNTVEYCTIKGSESNATSGIVFFSSASSIGNNNNTIDSNNITNSADANRPLNAIYSADMIGSGNNNLMISNNNLYNFLNRSTTSYGINLATNTTVCTITGNSLYETASFIPTGTVTYTGIYINNPSGNNFTITRNFIGGQAPSCGGSAWTKTNAKDNVFTAINLNVGSVTNSSVQGNTIQNFAWSNSGSAAWTGINSTAGGIDIGTITGNTIGATAGTGSIYITGGATGTSVVGINIISSGNTNCENNTIGSITVDNALANASNFYGINKSASAGTTIINNNIIGSKITPGSINANSASTASTQSVFGIYTAGTGTVTITGDTIANLVNNTTNATAATAGLINGICSTNGANTITNNSIHDLSIANANTAAANTASVCGIALTGNTLRTVSGNTIYNLANTNVSFAGTILGLYFSGGAGANVVSGNFIYGLTVNSGSTAAVIYGIKIASGATTYYNNIINLGGNTATTLYGIYENGAAGNNNNLYFNTIYIGGSLGSGIINKSYALFSAVSTNTRNFTSNLFSNCRSTTGGSNLHYAAYFNYAVATNLTLDYNDYFASGTGGVLGFYGVAPVPSLPLIAGKDLLSVSVDPAFTNAGGTNATDYAPGANIIKGKTVAGITTDYAGTTRAATPTMGVLEGTLIYNVQVFVADTLQGEYTNMKAAFDAINYGTHTGAIEIRLQESTIETASAVLFQSGYTGSGGVSSYTSVNIYPVVSGLSISGNLAAPLIDLSGADNVTIDGRVNEIGTTKDLSIINTSASNVAGTSTVRFVNDASGNLLEYCSIKGSETIAGSGIIFFSTGSVTGNDNNTIDNNSITNSTDANRPFNAIYSAGTAGFENSNLTISNNFLYDFLSRSAVSNGINLAANTTACSITGNSLYETTSFIPTASVAYMGISVNNAATATGFTITNNYIGGQAALCGGGAWSKSNAFNNAFTAINLNVASTVAGSVQGNTIQNFTWGNSGAGSWTGINSATGNVNIGNVAGNTIGASSGTGSITVTGGVTATTVTGINIATTGAVDCENNIIASIIAANSDGTAATNFVGIIKTAVAGTTTISNNTIGSEITASSINAGSGSTGTLNAQTVYGISSAGTGTVTITANTIANLTNGTINATATTTGLINGIYSTNGTNIISNNIIHDLSIANANNTAANLASTGGIVLTTASLKTVSGNNIYNLSNNNPSFTGSVIGLYFSGIAGANIVSGNFIYGLTVNSATTAASVYGIKIATGATTYFNNIINLGGNTATTIYGIYETGANTYNNNLYFNTVYIGGSLTTGISNPSYALYSSVSTNVRNFSNNIFTNARSTAGGTNQHYAAYFNYGVSTNLTLDYNDYFVSGTGGVLGYYNAANVTVLPIVATKDLLSISVDPVFANAGGTSATDYQPSGSIIRGTPIAAVPTDYAGTLRASTPTMGVYEGSLTFNIQVWNSGVLQASYTSLKAAFAAINNGTHTGAPVIKILQSTIETATAVLYQSGYGGLSSYTSVTIYPTVSGLSVSGNLATPLIDLNGADNVTFDGRVNATGSTKSLIISNTSASAVAGTSTIRFISDATANTVKYCTIKGSETAAASGVIFLSSAAITGNDFNTLDNNNITNSVDANRPVNAIYSAGTASFENDNLTISNNNIYDFLHRSIASNGINLAANTNTCSITGNSMYETATFIPTGSVAYNAIILNNATGNNFTITGNNIGGQAAMCGGSAWTKTNAFNNTFTAINVTVGATTVSNVHGNTIKNIAWGNSAATTWTGINISAGAVNVGTSSANTIGATSGNGSITVTGGATATNVYGINIASTATVDCENNTIGSFTVDNSPALATNFYGINKTASVGTTTISNNIIGSTATTNSITANSASTANVQSVYGILSAGSGIVTINGNTIANMTNNTTNVTVATLGLIDGISCSNGTNTISNNTIMNLSIANTNTSATNTASICGIALSAATLRTVSGNNIYNLSNTNSAFAGNVIGLYFSGSGGANVVSGNFIQGLTVNSGSTTASIYGIKIALGLCTYSNNIINLGGATATTLYGLYETGAAGNNNSLYFNTVYIGGTTGSGVTNKSYALYSNASTNVRNFRNNIFNNSRSTAGGVNLHYAAYLNYAVATSLTLDYNDYFTSGTGGVIAYYNGTNLASIPVLQSMVGQNLASTSVDPGFTLAGGTISTNYVPTFTHLAGITGTGITTDYSSATRATTPTMGAFDIALSLNVEVWKSGVFQARYPTLKNAFDKINDGTHTGALELRLTNFTEETTSAVLYQSGYSGLSSYTSVNIYPTVSGITISGNLATPLIDFNGADNVTLDGRVNATGSSKDLVITNISNSNVAATSTLRFINDATTNTIKYCILKGSETAAASGVVFFSTATAIGNNNNIIDNNSITNASDAARPLNAVYSAGTATYVNSSITISNNTLYNFFSRSAASYGINLTANTTACSVTGNSLYETASFVPTASVAYTGIYLNNIAGNGYTVSGNSIGGQSAGCGGGAWTKTNTFNNTFTAINLSVGTIPASSVQNNTIRNFAWSNSLNAAWTGINIGAGNTNIGTTSPNTIGGTTGTGSIAITSGTTGSIVTGILLAGSGLMDCEYNAIGSLSTTNASTDGSTIYGINRTGSGVSTISNNTIGSTSTANSINATSTCTVNVQSMFGINNTNTTSLTVNGNTVANLTNGSTNPDVASTGVMNGITTSSGATTITNNTIYNLTIANGNSSATNTASVCGIACTGNYAKTVSGNTVYNLSNTYTSFTGNVLGIYYAGNAGVNVVSGNFIYGLSVSGSSTAGGIYGILAFAGTTTYSNNIINLGGNTATSIYGIYDTGTAAQTCNLYFNTIYIGGSLTSGVVNKSYGLYSAASSNTRNFRNNLIVNARSTSGGAGLHYGAYFNYGVSTLLTLDYNDYQASGTGGVLGYYNSANVSILPLISGFDSHSLNINPYFTSPGSTTASNYMIGVELIGIAGTGITTDYSSTTRNTPPSIGALEVVFNKWKGTTSTDWNTASNWTRGTVPTDGSNLYFDAATVNNCLLNANHPVNNIYNNSSTYHAVANGYKLSIDGDIISTAAGQIDATATNSIIEFAGTSAQAIPSGVFYNNQIYNLTINNANNVTLNGTLRLLNTITCTTGQLDALSNSPVVSFAGTTAQTINAGRFLSDKVYSMTIDNSAGVTLNSNFTVNNLLTINTGKSLTIPSSFLLNVAGTITNNAGISGLIIKASSTGANGSLIFHNAIGSPVSATVEMYSKANWDLTASSGNKYKWQYFGIPVRSIVTNPTFNGSYVRKWYESGLTTQSHWIQQGNDSTLTSFVGYELCQAAAETLVFQGQLENSDFDSGQLSVTPTALFPGQHIYANPYTAAINIGQLTFGSQTEATVYLYNSGALGSWNGLGQSTPGDSPGQYTAVPKYLAGTLGVPLQIPSMEAVLVKAISNSSLATFGINYNSVVMTNTDPLRVTGSKDAEVTDKICTMIDVQGTRFSDRMWLISNTACTHQFDNGWDGLKLAGSTLVPQLFAVEPDGNYQINAVDNINNVELGFQAGVDVDYTLTFTHTNLDKLYSCVYLMDLRENKTVDITTSGSTYSFTSTTTPQAVNRFRIVARMNEKGATGKIAQISMFSSGETIFVRNNTNMPGELMIYDMSGHFIKETTFTAGGISTFPVNLIRGAYIVKAVNQVDEVAQRIIIL